MRKRLEAELISIAHRVLKLKNKSDIDQLHKEAQKLYETLSVLKFYQDNIAVLKSDITEAELEEKVERFLDKTAEEEETVPAIAPEVEKETPAEEPAAYELPEVEDESFEDNDLVAREDLEDHEEIGSGEIEEEEVKLEALAFEPVFDLEEAEEAVTEEEVKETVSEVKAGPKKIMYEALLGDDYKDPVFVKPGEAHLFTSISEEIEPKSAALNDILGKSIAIGLNDRIGFVNHLFDGSDEDFNRVLSQLNTFDNFEDAKSFIDDMVKPDYDNWEGQKDFEERFMEVVEKKFQ